MAALGSEVMWGVEDTPPPLESDSDPVSESLVSESLSESLLLLLSESEESSLISTTGAGGGGGLVPGIISISGSEGAVTCSSSLIEL